MNYAVISGPTFSGEVANGLPTAVTIAANSTTYVKQLAELFHTKTFRPYISDDIIGIEIGGAVKNVLAIAAGIADGLGYGANTRAAVIGATAHGISVIVLPNFCNLNFVFRIKATNKPNMT